MGMGILLLNRDVLQKVVATLPLDLVFPVVPQHFRDWLPRVAWLTPPWPGDLERHYLAAALSDHKEVQRCFSGLRLHLQGHI